MLLGLLQKNRRRRERTGQGLLSTGLSVYKVLPELGRPSFHTGGVLLGMFWPVIGVRLSYHLDISHQALFLLP